MRTLIVLLLLVSSGFAGEREEVERLATKYHARTEVSLWDGARVDMLNDTYAIEADWAHKWAEGVGQSLYYAAVTGRKPALLLLVKDRSDRNSLYRAQTVCARHGIKLFIEKVTQ